MVLGDDSLDEGSQAVDTAPVNGVGNATSAYNMEMMESIVQRLKPEDRHQIRDMISERGRTSGALAIASILFWWLAIHNGGDTLGDSDLPNSMIGDFTFYRLSLIVPGLTLIATILLTMGREKGQSLPSNAGGVLAIGPDRGRDPAASDDVGELFVYALSPADYQYGPQGIFRRGGARRWRLQHQQDEKQLR